VLTFSIVKFHVSVCVVLKLRLLTVIICVMNVFCSRNDEQQLMMLSSLGMFYSHSRREYNNLVSLFNALTRTIN